MAHADGRARGVENGLPHTEHLTVLGEGSTWTDQQWLAQVVFYAAHGLAGMRAVILLGIAFVLLALGARVRDRADGRRVVPLDLRHRLPRDPRRPVGLDAPRADGGAPLFAAALWLLVDASRTASADARCSCCRCSSSGRTSTAPSSSAPASRCSSGSSSWCAHDASTWIPLALVVLSPLCVLATPYGWDIVAYYKLMLVDAPFAPILREWQWSSPSGTTALFWLLALVAAGDPRPPALQVTADLLRARRPRRDVRGAVQAVRGVIWFALAAAAILPVALDGLLTKADVAAPRVNRIISLAALAGLAVAALVFVARPASWFVSEWPEARVAAVREATRDPNVRVWATDGTADWLLWRIPDLRGRLAYDVRFELYDQPTLDRIVGYGARARANGGARWTATA